MMMRAVQLDNLAIARNQDILEIVGRSPIASSTTMVSLRRWRDRRALSCYDFQIDNRGFTARSNLEEETLMFFSVPYDEGWSATVNGEEAPHREGQHRLYGGAGSGRGRREIRF